MKIQDYKHCILVTLSVYIIILVSTFLCVVDLYDIRRKLKLKLKKYIYIRQHFVGTHNPDRPL